MTAGELIAKLKHLNPDMPVIVASLEYFNEVTAVHRGKGILNEEGEFDIVDDGGEAVVLISRRFSRVAGAHPFQRLLPGNLGGDAHRPELAVLESPRTAAEYAGGGES